MSYDTEFFYNQLGHRNDRQNSVGTVHVHRYVQSNVRSQRNTCVPVPEIREGATEHLTLTGVLKAVSVRHRRGREALMAEKSARKDREM